MAQESIVVNSGGPRMLRTVLESEVFPQGFRTGHADEGLPVNYSRTEEKFYTRYERPNRQFEDQIPTNRRERSSRASPLNQSAELDDGDLQTAAKVAGRKTPVQFNSKEVSRIQLSRGDQSATLKHGEMILGDLILPKDRASVEMKATPQPGTPAEAAGTYQYTYATPSQVKGQRPSTPVRPSEPHKPYERGYVETRARVGQRPTGLFDLAEVRRPLEAPRSVTPSGFVPSPQRILMVSPPKKVPKTKAQKLEEEREVAIRKWKSPPRSRKVFSPRQHEMSGHKDGVDRLRQNIINVVSPKSIFNRLHQMSPKRQATFPFGFGTAEPEQYKQANTQDRISRVIGFTQEVRMRHNENSSKSREESPAPLNGRLNLVGLIKRKVPETYSNSRSTKPYSFGDEQDHGEPHRIISNVRPPDYVLYPAMQSESPRLGPP
eukprot:TRINITY_DN867_c0_g1_i3.p1 TRINITY_DN867_c0_g1~~TRINITY_DN867_c0_g1_i3.p1  ORF type:complete len:434 (+),score=58.85 TRINITY_DN867_c0_g1_i3:263-1564(+)